MMLKTALLILFSLLIAGVSGGEYVIVAPDVIQPGSNFPISIDILNKTDVVIEASIMEQIYNGLTGRYDYNSILNGSGTFSSGSIGTISLPIKSDIKCNNCQVRIRATGNLQFERVFYASVSYQVVAIIVQTDKAIYKPGQQVRFRVFAVYPNLQLYSGGISVDISDPNNNKIKVLSNVTSHSGVVVDNLQLSDQTPFGTWTINVNLVDVIESYSQVFEVTEYVLPRYEVTVDLPPFALIKDDTLTGKVKARYTFGQPVKGYVELHVGPNQGPNSCGNLPATTQIGFEINGEASFTIPKEDIQRAVSIYNEQEVKVTAFVKEDTTGVRLNGSSVVTWYSNKYQIKFTDNTPSVFKAGLPYTAYIQVTTPDNKPPTDNNITLSVYTVVTYQQSAKDQSLYSVGQFTGTYGLPGRNVTVPLSGLVTIDIYIPKNSTSITIKASSNDVQSTKTVEKMHSPSNNFIQLSLLGNNTKSGNTASIKIDGTEALHEVIYEILSRGSVAASGTLDGKGKKSSIFNLTVTPELAPNVHFLAYYVRKNKEIIADSFTFSVAGIFKNNVTISLNKNQSEPNKEVVVEVTAEKGSDVFLSGVDQSVLLLKTGNDVTVEKVTEGVLKFDKGDKPKDPEFPLSSSATTVQEVFLKSGMNIITDVPLPSAQKYLAPVAALGFEGSVSRFAYSAKIAVSDVSDGPVEKLKSVERVRQIFPETFLWKQSTTGENGTAYFKALVPDTITSWIINSFAVHPKAGLGVSPTTAKLQVFRPFFVSLTHPSSVIHGEQFILQAVIYNYLENDVPVTVTLKSASNFQTIKPRKIGLELLESGDQVKEIQVKSQKQGVVYFPILASQIGLIDIEVTAQTLLAADGVRGHVTVKPGGAPVSFNYPIFAHLENKANFEATVDFTVPDSIVNGSDRARIKVTGDLIGDIYETYSLLQLPTGCGEQSMGPIASNVYIAEYLKTTGQLTPAIENKIKVNLNAGYQRQLTYQRSDGGFSAFGNSDEVGSTWLGAYVSRVLYDVKNLIFLDQRVLVRAVDWLVQRQNKDGSFNEFGKVLDSSTQGTGTGPALTAFVLLTFIKNRDLSGIDCSMNSDCYRSFQWGNATANAVKQLEGLLENDAIKDQFSLALVSYALTLAKSSKAQGAFAKFEKLALKEGGLQYWAENSTVSATQSSNFVRWRPPQVQSRPINILLTSYAILTYVAQNRLKDAFPSVQWLVTQRNSYGGFASSQDTSVGLQSLAAYASKSVRQDTKLDVKISNGAILAEFHIDQKNALVHQIKELASAPPKAHVAASGIGFALVEIVINFNVKEQLTTPSFDVSTVLLDDKIDSFNLMICSKWLWDRESGMVIQVISIPSGFDPDISSLGNVAGLKRSERKGSTLEVYFDEIRKTSVCYSIKMTRTDKVARTQKNYVVTSAYYNPSDQSINFWQPKKPSESNICDVCDGCCP